MNQSPTTSLLEFSFRSRPAIIEQLEKNVFDVLVIGGGIIGAGILLEATRRGLSAALIEKGDFASGTSSASSKLIHGGLRYLATCDFKLVYEASRERRKLQQLAPTLIHPQKFLIPVYKTSKPGLFTLSCGMMLYDLLATFRNFGMHRMYSRDSFRRIEPGIHPVDLVGGASYYDAVTDDARLTLETLLSAWAFGALPINYLCAHKVDKAQDHSFVVQAEDVISHIPLEIRARTIVNATGPWTNELLQKVLPNPGPEKIIVPTKGIHLVVPQDRLQHHSAIIMRTVRDNRVTFIIPWNGLSLIGTTDTHFNQSPDGVFADRGDVDYLLESLDSLFPHAHIGDSDIISTFAGLRPLVDSGEKSESKISREHRILAQDGIYTVAGGKLTTYMTMAYELVQKIISREPVKGRLNKNPEKQFLKTRSSCAVEQGEINFFADQFSNKTLSHLVRHYGLMASSVARLALANNELAKPIVQDTYDIAAEVNHAICFEMAMTLTDFFRRRTQIYLRSKEQGLPAAGWVADLFQKECAWSDEQKEKEISLYRSFVEKNNAFRNSHPEQVRTKR
jgi:glycerol-3-phosphate dehydrogenase